ncbi:MAG: GTPase ObgE [bacterium]
MFIDKARIYLKAGDGGNGCISFRREKYVSLGGPNGGDGGRGGEIVLKANKDLHTLIDFQYHPHYKAERGSHGQGSNKFGKKGDDLVINVPVGTVVHDRKTGKVLVDLTAHGQEIVVAKGGVGGRGNAKFKTKSQRAPKVAEKGEPGEEVVLELELKLIADVGLVGYPNAGKSTFLAHVSSAKPKIADYPFTTLTPNLGVVKVDEYHSLVLADIPGLIEGAHKGVGLGDEFLRHVERTRLLIHIVDIQGYDGQGPLENFKAVNKELSLYSPKLAQKPQIVALNKIDLEPDEKTIASFKNKLKKYKVFPVSAVTSKGLKELIYQAHKMLADIKPTPEAGQEEDIAYYDYEYKPDFEIKKVKGIYVVQGEKVEKLVAMTYLDKDEPLKRMQRMLAKMGVDEGLMSAGIEEGDTVRIGKIEFFYKR